MPKGNSLRRITAKFHQQISNRTKVIGLSLLVSHPLFFDGPNTCNASSIKIKQSWWVPAYLHITVTSYRKQPNTSCSMKKLQINNFLIKAIKMKFRKINMGIGQVVNDRQKAYSIHEQVLGGKFIIALYPSFY